MIEPRFKDKFFSSVAVKTRDTAMCIVVDKPPSKRPCMIWKAISDILEESAATIAESNIHSRATH